MKIGINLLYLIPGFVGGTETYAVSLLEALAELDQENEYLIFLNWESRDLRLPDQPNFRRIACGVRAQNRPARYLYEQLVLPVLLLGHRVELVHSLGYVAPLAAPCLNIVTLPDLNYITLGHTFSWLRRTMLAAFSRASARWCDQVVTISHFSKSEICEKLGTSPAKVSVTHLGPGWVDPAAGGPWEDLRSHYGLPEKYIIAFGGGALHKNIPRLIEAYGACPAAAGYPLVLMGHLPANVSLPEGNKNGSAPHQVRWLGYLPTEHIRPLLAHASLYVLPSLYEGFGMPILEAQAAGVLVVSSSAASLPEIGGEGAIYFNPLSVESMTDAIREGLEDTEKARSVRAAARVNLGRFSWRLTARATLDVYQQVVARPR